MEQPNNCPFSNSEPLHHKQPLLTEYDTESGSHYEGGIDEEKALANDNPIEQLVYSDFVNGEKSWVGNVMGKLDYHDQYFSRRLQMVDNSFCNLLLGFGGWVCNRLQVSLQIPLVMVATYLNAGAVLQHTNYNSEF